MFAVPQDLQRCGKHNVLHGGSSAERIVMPARNRQGFEGKSARFCARTEGTPAQFPSKEEGHFRKIS